MSFCKTEKSVLPSAAGITTSPFMMAELALNHPNPPFFRICRSVSDLLRVAQENADFESVEQKIAIIAIAFFVATSCNRPMILRLSNQELPVLATYA